MKSKITIGNGAGFLGDDPDAPRRLVEGSTLDYLTLEYLAELTLSILAKIRQKDPSQGYARDFIEVLRSLTDSLRQQSQLKIVTNGGGMNPLACASAAAKVLVEANLGEIFLGVVTGDDLLPRIAELQAAGCDFAHLDTAAPLASLGKPVVSANAYLGAAGIVEALIQQARIVITGRVADASLTLGPAIHEFDWKWDEWNKLAGGSVAGHLIECGAQVTGGYSTRWDGLNLSEVGYPLAELVNDGTCVITKPAKTGGQVDRRSVIEQLTYEIGDPRHYLTPDVDVDFTTVTVGEESPQRVKVQNATGRMAPATLKVSLAYADGYMAAGQLLVCGDDAVPKARECAKIIFNKLKAVGATPAQHHIELLGTGESNGAVTESAPKLREVVLRIAVRDPRREIVERFTRQIAPLITSGPAGLAGYAAGRPEVRSVIAFWPTLVPRELVQPRVEVRSAKEWVSSPPKSEI